MSGTQLQFTPTPNANGNATATSPSKRWQRWDGVSDGHDHRDAAQRRADRGGILAPMTVAEDSGAASVSLGGVFTDIDGDALTLSVSGNSNAALFAAPPTVLGTTLQFTPAPNRNGTATLTIRASDGNGGLVTTTQAVTVTPVNDTPTVTTPLADVTVAEDSAPTTVAIAGAFGDVESPATVTRCRSLW